MLGDGEDVLVAAARKIDDQQVIARLLRRDLGDFGERMRRLKGRYNAFELGETGVDARGHRAWLA